MDEPAQNQGIDNNQSEGLDFDQLAEMLDQTSAEGRTGHDTQAAEVQSSQSQSDGDQQTSETDQTQHEDAAEMTVSALAEQLGIEAAQLYNLQLDIGNGQQMTLGQLKDRAKDVSHADSLIAEVNEQRLSVENDLMQKRHAISRYAQRVGYQPTEQDQQEAQAELKAYREMQRALAIEFMPDWQSEETRATDIKGIEKLQDEYLFGQAEKAAMLDARLLKMMRDYHRLREEVRSVAKYRKNPKPKQGPKVHTKTGSSVTKIGSQAAQGKLSQDAAVGELGKLLG
jgi:hypothetical protein